MSNLPKIDTQNMVHFLKTLLETPSPTGFTDLAMDYVEMTFNSIPDLGMRRTRKGGLLITWKGVSDEAPRALTAHVDTLGAMVKEIKSNGRLKLSKLGGYPWNTVEGEGVTIFPSEGENVRGSILLVKSSVHVHGKKVGETERNDDNIEVRLDARTSTAEETQKLGIRVGDFVAFDPRVEVTNGFIRSRHLDDKACVANIYSAVQSMIDAGIQPAQTTTILISNYEEVGHGAAVGFPENITELVTVDMAAIGDGQTSDEFHATLCVKDSGGPYSYQLNRKLRKLAEEHSIPHKVDIYPYYGSDGEAFWRAGGDVQVSLIGPGVDASHNYERTHTDALEATTQWLMAYMMSEA